QIVFAKDLYDRQKNLWSQDIGTQIQLISAKNVYDTSIKRKNTLLSQKEMYLVKAPISGFVDDLMVKVGEPMSPGSPKGIRIVNANNLKIVTEIGEGNASSINQGDAVFINFPNINYALSSRISFVSKVIDEMSRTFKIEINLPSNSKIKPNMLAEIKVVSYKNPAAISIANGLIQSDSSGEFLMVVKNNKALKVYIKKGETYNGFSEIKEGLTAGEEIITNGYQGLEDGDDVEIIQNF
ncbi:MAG: efflux RND transporter periplasmic adaptor subunit, partial [Solirubrobacteraceae bacterium]